nr:hypothetical protein [Haloquadratum walsbyi]
MSNRNTESSIPQSSQPTPAVRSDHEASRGLQRFEEHQFAASPSLAKRR